MRIRDEKNSDPRSGMENIGYGIRDKHPGSATLNTTPVDPQGDLVESLGLGPVSLGSRSRSQPRLVEKSGLGGSRWVAADLSRGNKQNVAFSQAVLNKVETTHWRNWPLLEVKYRYGVRPPSNQTLNQFSLAVVLHKEDTTQWRNWLLLQVKYRYRYGVRTPKLFHVHSCVHWLRETPQSLPPPRIFGLINEGALGQPR